MAADCNTQNRENAQAKSNERHRYVLTFIKYMLIHFNAICLHISEKIRTFA